jgi:Transposase DDE domain
MYLRTISRRNKDGSTVRYLQLAHNVRNERGNAVAEVVHSFGREDELDRDALARLVRSISRFLDPEQALAASVGSELVFTGSRPYGGGYLLDALWRRLGIDKALTAAAAGRKVSPAVERLIFTLVANRALDPCSKRHALEWAAADVALPGVGELGGEPQVFYRAMDFLLQADPQIQEQVFFAVANLLNLEVDVLLFDTTSTYFETEDDDELRRYGHSKDHRPDRPQVVIGLAVTKEGIPVRVWCWPGNASDKTVIRQVHDDLRAWSLHRVLWVGDAGFTSAENRTYLQRAGGQVLFAEKLRQGNDNHAALARQGRYAIVTDNLHVKEVTVGEGAQARRFVVCRNLHEAGRDAARRDKALARLRDELTTIDTKTGDTRLAAEGELLANPTLRRYLTRVATKLVIDTKKVKAEQRLDGKFLLSCTDPTIPAADLAILYKGLLDVERCWRDLKQVIDIRPVYHSKDQRIKAHVLLCYLALMLIRVAENATGHTWKRIRYEMQRMHLGQFTGPAGHLQQRTETTPAQREILHHLKIKEPPVILHHTNP